VLRERVKSRLQVKFPDHYHDDPYEWQDFHECVHFLLAGTAAKSSVSTVTQACIPAVFTVLLTFSTLPPAAAIVKIEDLVSILQDSLWQMENIFARVIYQNAHGGAPAAYAPLQQYAAPPQQYAAPSCQYATLPPQQYSTPPQQSYTTSTVPTSAGPHLEKKCHFDGCPRMIRDCPGAAYYINRGLCKQDLTNNQIVLPNNSWILRWTTGNNIKEWLDDYYRQNPVPAAAAPVAIPLAPTTSIKDVPPHMSQNVQEVVENLHAAVSADPDNTDDDEAIIQALQQAQQALKQKKKKQVHFDGVEMPPMRKGPRTAFSSTQTRQEQLKRTSLAPPVPVPQSPASPSVPPSSPLLLPEILPPLPSKILPPLTPLVHGTVTPPR
jgi:hypothetical protein